LLKRGTPTPAYIPGAPVATYTGSVEDGGSCGNIGMVGIGDGEWGKLIWWMGGGDKAVVTAEAGCPVDTVAVGAAAGKANEP
jgi:hypothetical protein